MRTVYETHRVNLVERCTIEDLFIRNVNVTEIARRIGRHRSSVYREIKRNFYKDEELPQLDGYYRMNAQRFTAERRARRRKLVRIPALREAVIDRLQEGWSPEQIAGRLKLEGHATSVSHETIYAYVYSPDRPPIQFEFNIFTQHRFDTWDDVFRTFFFLRIGIPPKFEIQSPDDIRLFVQQGRLPPMKVRIKPKPTFSRELSFHHDISDQVVLLAGCD